jgi:putative FmdB family regulatory protein
MPLYEYYCGLCKENYDVVRSIDLRGSAECPNCSRMGSKIVSHPKIIDCVLEPTFDEGLGTMIKGPKHRREVMRSKGLEEA